MGRCWRVSVQVDDQILQVDWPRTAAARRRLCLCSAAGSLRHSRLGAQASARFDSTRSPSILAAFLASLVEFVEALTVVLAVGSQEAGAPRSPARQLELRCSPRFRIGLPVPR